MTKQYILFEEQAIVIKKGEITIPLTDIPLEDRAFIFREGAYTNQAFIAAFYEFSRPNQIQRAEIDTTRVTFNAEQRQLVVERDTVCCEMPGIAVYKRPINAAVTCIEIEYWREKDPVISRFLTLMIAIFAKESAGVSFLARNSEYCHFLFNVAFDAANEIFERTVAHVTSRKQKLLLTLQQYKKEYPLRQYSFFATNHAGSLSWPSRQSGVSYVEDGKLIQESLAVLRV